MENPGVPPGVVESAAATAFHPLRTLRVLGAAGGALFSQASLHSELAQVEWQEEKSRLLRLATAAALGYAALLCLLLFVGVLVLALTWDTLYRVPAVMAVIVVYAICAGIAWHRLQHLAAQGQLAFAASREELAADLEMLKGRL